MLTSIDELFSDTYYNAYLIKQRIDQVLLNTFPSETPRHLLKALQRICSLTQKCLVRFRRDFETAPDETLTLIKFISSFLRNVLAPEIRYAEGASLDKTPGSLVRALERLVDYSGLLKNATLLIRCQWHYDFKIFEFRHHYEYLLQNYLDIEQSKIDKIFADFPQNIYVISFPGFQKTNLLVQTILGHEIGHPIAAEYLYQKVDDYSYDIGVEVEDQFGREWNARNLTEDERDKLKADTIRTIVDLRKKIISEIISDLVASYLFNLGALFSLASDCSAETDIDAPPSVMNPHPAWRARLRYTLKDITDNQDLSVLDRLCGDDEKEKEFCKKIGDAVKKKIGHLRDEAAVKTDIRRLEDDDYTQIAYSSVTQALDDIKLWLKSRVPRYNIERNYEELIKCAARLKNGIPPNATNERNIRYPKITNIQTILISGSLYKETFLSSMDPDQEEKYRNNLDSLNQLMMKALELGLVHREFNEDKIKRLVLKPI